MVCQESPRETKPKKGPKRKVHEFRPFLWILVFFLSKTSTIHIELFFRNAPAKNSWTDLSLVWFAGATPEFVSGVTMQRLLGNHVETPTPHIQGNNMNKNITPRLSSLPCFEAFGVIFCPESCSHFCLVCRGQGSLVHFWIILKMKLQNCSCIIRYFSNCWKLQLHTQNQQVWQYPCRTVFPVVSQTVAATPTLLFLKMAYRSPKTGLTRGASQKKLVSEAYRAIGGRRTK